MSLYHFHDNKSKLIRVTGTGDGRVVTLPLITEPQIKPTGSCVNVLVFAHRVIIVIQCHEFLCAVPSTFDYNNEPYAARNHLYAYSASG